MYKFSKILKAAALFGILLVSGNAVGKITLPGMLANKMVIQRDAPVKIWGWSSPGEKVSVRFRDSIYTTQGNRDGEWQIAIKPQSPGGPFLMEINDITLRDVLIGDLWLMSGQSNQELDIKRVVGLFPEVNVSDNNKIRHFKVPKATSPYPQKDIPEGGVWKSGVASEVTDWTALAFFLAQKAYEQTGVPQGMLVSCLGGSSIETWIEPELLSRLQPDKTSLKELVEAAYEKGDGVYPAIDFDDSEWESTIVPGYWRPTPDQDDSGWKKMLETEYGKSYGINHKGTVWYRKKFDIPADLAGRHAVIDLGTLVDSDQTFVNGVLVGSTGYQYPPRHYQIPAGVLREGENVVTVKLTDNSGNGAFIPDKTYRIVCDGVEIDLKGIWKTCKGRQAGALERLNREYSNQMEARSGLYNTMLLPLANCSFKGVVWYQGESNASRWNEYQALLSGMIGNWRETFNMPELPFIIVQLPNFMASRPDPSDGWWARLREAQMKAAQNTPHTYYTVNYDLGEWNDIHPLNKKDVAERIWRSAANNIYGRKVEGHSPQFEKMEIKDNKVILTFSHVGKGLKCRDGKLKHFAIAGEDRKFVWADAVVKGDKVIVSSKDVMTPVAVRYAWADNPEGANLISSEGLSAAPFRTDDW